MATRKTREIVFRHPKVHLGTIVVGSRGRAGVDGVERGGDVRGSHER